MRYKKRSYVKVEKHCLNCGNPFYVKNCHLNDLFCSRNCWRTWVKSGHRLGGRPKPEYGLVCRECGSDFKSSRSTKVFCSPSCWRLWSSKRAPSMSRRGEANGNWTGGIHENRYGYCLVSTGSGLRKMEHRIVAEKALDRTLNCGEIVHHINGNKSDNRNKNLLICDRSYHKFLHEKMAGLYQWEHFGP